MRIFILFILLAFVITQSSFIKYRNLATNSLGYTILSKYKSVSVHSSIGVIVFDSKDFDEGEDIYFKIKAVDFYTDYVFYYFGDTANGISDVTEERLSKNKAYFAGKTLFETIDGIKYRVKYFTINKDINRFYGSKGLYLYIVFFIDGYKDKNPNQYNDGMVFLENTVVYEGIPEINTYRPVVLPTDKPKVDEKDYSYLKTTGKYGFGKTGSITMDAEDNFVVFETELFDVGQDMYFKIKAIDYYVEYVLYYFADTEQGIEDVTEERLSNNVAYFRGKTTFEFIDDIQYKVKYFTINKDQSKFYGSEGKYLYIVFFIDADKDNEFNKKRDGKVIIENTLEDEGNLEVWMIIVIVIVFVFIVALFVGLCCWCRKRRLTAQNILNPVQSIGIHPNNVVPYHSSSRCNVNPPFPKGDPIYNTRHGFK